MGHRRCRWLSCAPLEALTRPVRAACSHPSSRSRSRASAGAASPEVRLRAAPETGPQRDDLRQRPHVCAPDYARPRTRRAGHARARHVERARGPSAVLGRAESARHAGRSPRHRQRGRGHGQGHCPTKSARRSRRARPSTWPRRSAARSESAACSSRRAAASSARAGSFTSRPRSTGGILRESSGSVAASSTSCVSSASVGYAPLPCPA